MASASKPSVRKHAPGPLSEGKDPKQRAPSGRDSIATSTESGQATPSANVTRETSDA